MIWVIVTEGRGFWGGMCLAPFTVLTMGRSGKGFRFRVAKSLGFSGWEGVGGVRLR